MRLLKLGKFVVTKVKDVVDRDPAECHGKMSVKQLVRKDEGATNVDISKTELRDFQKVAKKYGVDFAVVKHNDQNPPVCSIFFKARDQDAITDVIRYYTNQKLMKSQKPSLIQKIHDLKDKVAKIPGKVAQRVKGRSR